MLLGSRCDFKFSQYNFKLIVLAKFAYKKRKSIYEYECIKNIRKLFFF